MNSHGKNRKGYKAICGRIWLPLLLHVVSHHERGGGGGEDVIYATRIRADDLHFWLRRRYMNALQLGKERK